MALPEAGVGLLPCAGGTQGLPWRVCERWSKRNLLRDERVDAATALRIGLIEQCVDSDACGHALLLAPGAAWQSLMAVRAIKPRLQGALERAPK